MHCTKRHVSAPNPFEKIFLFWNCGIFDFKFYFKFNQIWITSKTDHFLLTTLLFSPQFSSFYMSNQIFWFFRSFCSFLVDFVSIDWWLLLICLDFFNSFSNLFNFREVSHFSKYVSSRKIPIFQVRLYDKNS